MKPKIEDVVNNNNDISESALRETVANEIRICASEITIRKIERSLEGTALEFENGSSGASRVNSEIIE